jgi:PKD repeat protein
MKKMFYLISTIGLALLLQSCKKTASSAVDCISEAIFVKVGYTADPSNSKKINFTATDSGEYPLKSVDWNYGDGSTGSTTTLTSTHTYANTGTYTVTANVNVASCTIKPQKSVTVN